MGTCSRLLHFRFWVVCFFFGACLDQGPFLGAFIKRDGFNQAGRLLSTAPLTFPWELDTVGHAWAVPWGRAAAPGGVGHHPVALLSAFRGSRRRQQHLHGEGSPRHRSQQMQGCTETEHLTFPSSCLFKCSWTNEGGRGEGRNSSICCCLQAPAASSLPCREQGRVNAPH